MHAMDLVARLRECLDPFPAVRLAVLFGSSAGGEVRPGGDVDVGLLLDPYSAELRFRLDGKLYRAVRKPIDTVLLDDAPPLLRFEITRGVLILEREAGLWTQFKVRAWRDWWDWAPYARRINAAIIARLREEVRRDGAA
jgi:predicted nucleotidyltransferase